MIANQVIAHYRITGKLGEGGMGEVWRATDTRLNRDVALKILPEAFANDRERMVRFEREAQVLASLNHPNIAAIYGIEQSVLVMEFVEGVDLKGPLPLDTALDYARQIAAALEAAHEKGIIHRDLKPANIKVTPTGQVKLLDFGLAKASEASSTVSSQSPAMSPTLSLATTQAGIILGTAAYMSPEQARGKPVDKRADIWAFGVVLYEMLTGSALFGGGETISDCLAAVITKEPDLDRVPAKVRRLLRRCLEKDPRKRLRDIGDAFELLEDAPAPVVKPSKLPWAAAGVALLSTLVLGVVLWKPPLVVEQPLLSLSVDLGPEAEAGRNFTVAISPDGKRIAFPVHSADGRRSLAVRLLSEPGYTVLPGTEGAENAFFSPDGEWVGLSSDRKLKKVSVHGGAAIPLCDASSLRGASWGEDGYIVATLTTVSGLVRVPAAGGTPQPLTKVGEKGEITHRWPQMLPGGQAVLLTSHTAQARFDEANVDVLSLKTGQRKTIQHGGYFGRYLPTGHLVFLRGSTLFAVPFDPVRLETRGTPAPLLEGIQGNVGFGGGQFDVSRNGTFVYLPGKFHEGQPTVLLDTGGKIEPLLPAGYEVAARISPNGQRLATLIRFPRWDLKVYDLKLGTSTQLTFNAGVADPASGPPGLPTWTPDSRHIVYRSGNSIYWIRADGAGESQVLVKDQIAAAPYSFSPDGKRLAYSAYGVGRLPDLFTIPLDMSDPEHPKAGKPEPFLETSFVEVHPVFSPDGRWIAYGSDESQETFEVFVRPFGTRAGPAGKWKISNGGGMYPVWSQAGRQLLYRKPTGPVMVVDYAVTADSFQALATRPWLGASSGSGPFDLAPDGKHLILGGDFTPRGEPKGNLHVTMLVNWFDEVRRRVPGGK